MKFQFEVVKKDYSDFSSGRVLFNAPKTTAFPVRLASEIMARCLSLIKPADSVSIYDPCCGGAHLLTVVGFLYRENLNKVYGTDIDGKVVEYAQRNLSLLTTEGLSKRKESIKKDYHKYGKDSHLEALHSADRLMSMSQEAQNTLKDIQCFKWDITSSQPPPFRDINIVMTDLPYGNVARWKGEGESNPVVEMLNNVYQALDVSNSVVAIVSDKQQKIKHEWFEQVKRLKHGKRQITFLRPSRTSVFPDKDTVPSR